MQYSIFLVFSSKLKKRDLQFLEKYFENVSLVSLKNYFLSYPTYFLFLDKIPIGFLTFQTILDEVHILNFGIAKNFQFKGFGKLLLKIFLYNYKNKTIYLEVLKDNKVAINLYKSLGFKILGERKNFYKNKDAYLMSWKRREK